MDNQGGMRNTVYLLTQMKIHAGFCLSQCREGRLWMGILSIPSSYFLNARCVI